MTYYDNKEELRGAVRDLAVKRLGASETDLIEYATYTWDSGYCETCSYTEYAFAVLLNGEPVYDSRENWGSVGWGGEFAAFQAWLDGEEETHDPY